MRQTFLPQHERTFIIGARMIPDRPGYKKTCFRMTDLWWEICSSCWNLDSLFLSMNHVVDMITKIVRFSMFPFLGIFNLDE